MIIKSETVLVPAKSSEVLSFLSNAEHLIHLLPKDQISDSVDSFDAQINKLIDLIDAAYGAGQSAGDSLNLPFDALQKSWEDLEAQAAAQVDKTSAYLEELIDQTLTEAAEKIGMEWVPT